jgi:hypothetical protein
MSHTRSRTGAKFEDHLQIVGEHKFFQRENVSNAAGDETVLSSKRMVSVNKHRRVRRESVFSQRAWEVETRTTTRRESFFLDERGK